MVSLLLTLLRVLFPLDPVARLREITRDYINWLVSCLEDEQKLEDLHTNPLARAGFAAHILVAEHGVNLLIHDRARQLAGLPFLYRPRMQPPELRRVRPLVQIIDRLSRVAEAFHHLERLAARRAQRIKRELSENPLRLDASHRSTSPMLRMVEDLALLLEVLPRRRRGRWIGASSRRDGGGLFAQPRGPPTPSISENQNSHLAGAPARAHPRVLRAQRPGYALTIPVEHNNHEAAAIQLLNPELRSHAAIFNDLTQDLFSLAPRLEAFS